MHKNNTYIHAYLLSNSFLHLILSQNFYLNESFANIIDILIIFMSLAPDMLFK